MTKEMNTVLELIQAMAEKITSLEYGRESDQSTIKNLEERSKFMGEGMDNLRAIKQTLSEELSRVQGQYKELNERHIKLRNSLTTFQMAIEGVKHDKKTPIRTKRQLEAAITLLHQS